MFAWRRCHRDFGPLIAQRQAGALPADEAATLERHLRACDGCRAADSSTREMVEGIRDAARTGSLSHPQPEELAALSSGGRGLSAKEVEGIERHLESCADCRTEWNVATAWSSARPPVSPPIARRVRWGWFASGALSAAAAVALFAVLSPRDAPQPADGRGAIEAAEAPVQVRSLHHRAPSEPTPLVVRKDAGAVLVSLTVEAPPGSTLEVELHDETGGTLARAELNLEDRAGQLMLSVSASELPEHEGEFLVRVVGTDESFHYPFRVERDGS